VFLGVLTVIKVAGFLAAEARAERLVRNVIAHGKPDCNDLEEHTAKSKALADELASRNLFAPMQPRRHPVTEVSGILGSEALINDKWYKAGDKIEDATIVSIGPTQVKIAWADSEKIFTPITAMGSEQTAEPRPARPGNRALWIVNRANHDSQTTMPDSRAAGSKVASRQDKTETKKTSDEGSRKAGSQKRSKLNQKEDGKLGLLIEKGKFEKLMKDNTEKTQAKKKKDVAPDQDRKPNIKNQNAKLKSSTIFDF